MIQLRSTVRSFVHICASELSERHCLAGRTSVIIMESYALIMGAILQMTQGLKCIKVWYDCRAEGQAYSIYGAFDFRILA